MVLCVSHICESRRLVRKAALSACMAWVGRNAFADVMQGPKLRNGRNSFTRLQHDVLFVCMKGPDEVHTS